MPKSSRRSQAKFRSRYTPKADASAVQSVAINKTQPINKAQLMIPAYDAAKNLKNDLKWTAITTLIVILCLVIAYIFFR